MARNTLSRSLHDLGLAASFGGTLANAVALNPCSCAETDTDTGPGAVANTGWDRWTPVNAAAIARLTRPAASDKLGGDSGRILGQKGVGSMVLVKTGLTVRTRRSARRSPTAGRSAAPTPPSAADHRSLA